MITLDVLFFPGQIENRSLDHSAVVVVDVLRATTSIAAALSAGADGVLPVAEEPEARRTVERLCQNGEPVLLCGRSAASHHRASISATHLVILLRLIWSGSESF